VQQFLTGVGTGTAQLLNPAFSLVELARQGSDLFGFGSGQQAGGGRPTGQRPREVATTFASDGARPGLQEAVSSIVQSGSGAAFRSQLQAGFRGVREAGLLDQYRGYYRDLAEYLTPAQRAYL